MIVYEKETVKWFKIKTFQCEHVILTSSENYSNKSKCLGYFV